eukprot:COSAG06_NODE_322_length_17565_cov_152.607752_3_plen_124_part_00
MCLAKGKAGAGKATFGSPDHNVTIAKVPLMASHMCGDRDPAATTATTRIKAEELDHGWPDEYQAFFANADDAIGLTQHEECHYKQLRQYFSATTPPLAAGSGRYYHTPRSTAEIYHSSTKPRR